ncbi:hypothetical protein KIN20_034680 [Parelaphostrongylus tenuis]|uniref:Uncharacterized protein n=1 Tax=Parelaphostrongylus tenuis TaxID=148309 RepID=A0AAD5RCY7_PARTN|nr:hypothetical protein KIN20_034680 [Parelaphostrongylus tenuis]
MWVRVPSDVKAFHITHHQKGLPNRQRLGRVGMGSVSEQKIFERFHLRKHKTLEEMDLDVELQTRRENGMWNMKANETAEK